MNPEELIEDEDDREPAAEAEDLDEQGLGLEWDEWDEDDADALSVARELGVIREAP